MNIGAILIQMNTDLVMCPHRNVLEQHINLTIHFVLHGDRKYYFYSMPKTPFMIKPLLKKMRPKAFFIFM